MHKAQLWVKKWTWRLCGVYSQVELMVVLVLIGVLAIFEIAASERGQLKFVFDDELNAEQHHPEKDNTNNAYSDIGRAV